MELRTEAEARCGALFLCTDQAAVYMKTEIHGIVEVIVLNSHLLRIVGRKRREAVRKTGVARRNRYENSLYQRSYIGWNRGYAAAQRDSHRGERKDHRSFLIRN